MKIGLGQIDMGFEDFETGMRACQQMLRQATLDKVDLVIFPEMTLTGFTLHPDIYAEELANSATVRFFRNQAIQNAVAIGFGMAVKEDVGLGYTNHFIMMDKNGKTIADYTKIHPFSFGAEAKFYSGGDKLVTCQLDGVVIAPMICYDLRFPEVFQIVSESAHVIPVIASWPVQRREHWMALLKARAIENQCYIVGVNRIGYGGGLEYSGDSMMIAPSGKVLVNAHMSRGLLSADIATAEVAMQRDVFPMKRDRKPKLYRQLWQDHNA